MYKQIAVSAAVLAMLAGPSAYAGDEGEMTKGEKELAKLLEGRVAGEPKSCINTFGSRTLRTIDGTALVYDAGNTIWVNYTKRPELLDDSDYLVIERFSSSGLCRTDQITTRDRGGNFFSGVIFLDDFIPYRKVEKEG